METLEVDGVKHPVKIYYEKRNGCRVSIRKKAVYIRIPVTLSKKEKLKQLASLKKWAMDKIRENPERFKPVSQKEYKNGETLLNYVLSLEFKDKKGCSARVDGSVIYLSISSNMSKEEQNKQISTLLSRCIAKERLPELRERIEKLNRKHFNKPFNKVFFKYNKSNWGSCSKAGNINISTRLLFAPEDILEYVCVHELAHLVELNHSKKFWSLVGKVVPDWKAKRAWLRKNGKEWRF